jgi:hypothetical protein
MKTLIHSLLLFCLFPNLSPAAPDKLEEKIGVIKKAIAQTITSIKSADSKARKCTDNYDKNVSCPNTTKSRGLGAIKQEFTDPILGSANANKGIVEKDLMPLPAIVKKMPTVAELGKVDSCSGGEKVLQEDLQKRLDALNKGKQSLKKIIDGKFGTKTWYARLHQPTREEAKLYKEMVVACAKEAGKESFIFMAPKNLYEFFQGAFKRDMFHIACDARALKNYEEIAGKDAGTFKKINDSANEINLVLDNHIKKLEEQISLSKKRLEKCPSAKDAKKEEPKAKEEQKPDTSKVDEKKSTISGDSENCVASVGPNVGSDGKTSCYQAAGTAKERSSRLATLRKENPEALEKALIDRDTPEAKALSKQLLDEADAYAKSQNPPLPSPKASATDAVCGESCVAYLKAKSAEQSGLDAQTVGYLKKKASTTQKKKLQDLSY